jgi:hypothetical protein
VKIDCPTLKDSECVFVKADLGGRMLTNHREPSAKFAESVGLRERRGNRRSAPKVSLSLAVFAIAFITPLLLPSAFAAKLPAGGFRGVPWTGSRDDFKRAIPGLICAPLGCDGYLDVGDIKSKVEVVWGGFAAHVTSITLRFSKSRVSDMAKVLRTKYGSPSNQHREDGELVTEWKLPDVLVDLYHGSAGESEGVVYFEPTAQAKIQHDEFKSYQKRKADDRKRSMKDAASAW